MRRLLAGLVLCAACGGGDNGGTAGSGRIRMVPNVVAGSQLGAGNGPMALVQAPLRIGQGRAANLKSLKYYITSIQLCQNVTLMGSGFSSTEGCIELYSNQTPSSPDYPSYTVNEAMADNTAGRYIDLMSAEGQAVLRRPVTLEVPVAPDAPDGGPTPDAAPEMRVGAYRYGLINFYRPIKATAEFPVLGQPGQYFRTKAVTNVRSTPAEMNGFNTQAVDIGDTLSGATEETTYMLNNGGVLFTFQKPFVITQSDIDSQAEIKIDLVFNPDNFGQVTEVQSCTSDRRHFICDPLNNVAIDMPYVRMSPVPRKSGERTRKETYLMDYDPSAKLRIELYYNDGDPEAGVQGVDVALVYEPTATQPTINTVSANFVTQIGSVTRNDASVSLLDYQRSVNVASLRRRQSGNVTLHCLLPHPACPTAGGTVTKAYSYVGDTIVSTD